MIRSAGVFISDLPAFIFDRGKTIRAAPDTFAGHGVRLFSWKHAEGSGVIRV